MAKKQFANPLERKSAGSTLQVVEPAQLITLKYDYSQIAEVHRQDLQNDARTYRLREQRVEQDLLANAAVIVRWRKLLPHGQFEEWVRTELEISPRKAQMMMHVAEQYEGKSETVSLLGLTNAQLLSAPSVPEKARQQAQEEAERLEAEGKKLTKTRTQEIINKTKQPAPPPHTRPASAQEQEIDRGIKTPEELQAIRQAEYQIIHTELTTALASLQNAQQRAIKTFNQSLYLIHACSVVQKAINQLEDKYANET